MVVAPLLCLCLLAGLVSGTKFPNDIEGIPEINCEQEKLTITVKTTSGNAGHIFAKGRYGDSACNFNQTNSATFSLSGCGMNRQRQLDPKGLSYNLVVVVQLHPRFITKVDRAYHIKCFYMEADKTVAANLDVSMLTTDLITAGHAMPQCMYKLHMESPNGPAVRYAKIGDKVWHVWECPSDVYGMLIHSCVVDDGQGNTIRILDENGCGVDKYVMKTPEYSADLTRAQQETHVFKFADKVSVYFNCQIKLCFKNEACQGVTPPRCPDSSKVAITGQVDNTPLNQTRPTETQPAVTEKSVGKTNRNQTDNNGTEVENLILTTIATNVSEVEKNTTQRPTEKPAVTVGITSENVTSLNSTQREAEATQESLNITSSGTENTTISSVTTSTFGAANISELLNMTDITNVTEITRTFTNITELANATGITSGNITDLLNTTESTFVNNATITNAEGNVTEAGRNHTIESSNFTTVAVANETSVEILTNTTFVSLLNTTESHNESEVIITPIVPISKNETEKANSTGFPLLNITEFVASVNDSPIINVNEEFGEVVRLQFDLAENLTSELPSFSTEKFEGSGEEGFTLPVSISTEVTTDRITPSKKTAIPTPSTFVPHTDSSKSLTIDEFEDRRLRDEGFLLDEARGRRNVFGSTNVPQMQAVRDVNHRDELQLDVNQEMFVLEPDDADQFLALQQPNSSASYRHGILSHSDTSRGADDSQQVCLSPVGFGVVLSAFSVLLLFCLSLVLWICIRKPNRVGVTGKSRGSSASDLLRHSSMY